MEQETRAQQEKKQKSSSLTNAYNIDTKAIYKPKKTTRTEHTYNTVCLEIEKMVFNKGRSIK